MSPELYIYEFCKLSQTPPIAAAIEQYTLIMYMSHNRNHELYVCVSRHFHMIPPALWLLHSTHKLYIWVTHASQTIYMGLTKLPHDQPSVAQYKWTIYLSHSMNHELCAWVSRHYHMTNPVLRLLHSTIEWVRVAGEGLRVWDHASGMPYVCVWIVYVCVCVSACVCAWERWV